MEMGSPHTRSLVLFSDISGEINVAGNCSSSASDASPSSSSGLSAGDKIDKKSSATTVRVSSSGTLRTPPGGDASLRIDAMNYEFERTNSESSHTILPLDESHTPSLTNKLDFSSETHLFR